MATPSSKRVIMPTDILYLVTFAAGMAAFWISGHASALMPVMKNHQFAITLRLIATGGVYALGMVLLGTLVMRRL